jgi:hypothetical protein
MLLQNRKKRSTYILVAIAVLLIEIAIERYLNDPFIRPYLGDALVVVLIYAFIMAVTKWHPTTAMIITLAFSYAVEFAQTYNVIEILGLESSAFFRTILGTSFSWIDLVMYTLGVAAVYVWELMTIPRTIK